MHHLVFFLGKSSGPLFYVEDKEVRQDKLFFSAVCVHGVLWYVVCYTHIIDTYIYG